MSSGIFPQPRSTVSKNCPVGFVINHVLGSVCKPELRGIGGWLFPPSGTHLSTGLALPALVFCRDQCCVGKGTTVCCSSRQICSLSSGLSVCAWESLWRLLGPASPPGLQSMPYSHSKALGSSCNARAGCIRCVIINYWQSTQRWDCDSSVLCFFYRKRNSFKS